MASELFGLLSDSREKWPSERTVRKDLANLAGIEAVVKAVLNGNKADGRLIIFIDQFEELFTLAPGPADGDRLNAFLKGRDDIIDFLINVGLLPHAFVLVTLRADYWSRIEEIPRLYEVMRRSIYCPPASLSANSLLSVIRLPAIYSGLKFREPNYRPRS